MPKPSTYHVPNFQKIIIVANAINICIIIRIQCKKIIGPSYSRTRSLARSLTEYASDPYNISELRTIIFIATIFFINANFNSYLNNLNPKSFNTFPHGAIFHIFRLAWPVVIVLIMFILQFTKQPNLKRLWMKALKDIFVWHCRQS